MIANKALRINFKFIYLLNNVNSKINTFLIMNTIQSLILP